jgi:hypothetical protein
VFGIVVMAVLLGGPGAGFATGYEYKCMEEEQLFEEVLAEANDELGCSCYYTGDMRRGFECLGDCLNIRMEEYNVMKWPMKKDTTQDTEMAISLANSMVARWCFELMKDVGSGSYDAVCDCLIVHDFNLDDTHRMPWPREKVKYVVCEEKIE